MSSLRSVTFIFALLFFLFNVNGKHNSLGSACKRMLIPALFSSYRPSLPHRQAQNHIHQLDYLPSIPNLGLCHATCPWSCAKRFPESIHSAVHALLYHSRHTSVRIHRSWFYYWPSGSCQASNLRYCNIGGYLSH